MLLEGLTPAQREAVVVDGAPLCILAGAGSGKTRVLTRRIAHRVATETAEARHVLTLTFTRHAAGELRRRLQALGVRELVAAGTFHAVAYAQLRRRWLDRGERPPVLLERKSALLARFLDHRRGGASPAEIAAEIEWAKARMVAPADYERAATAAGRRAPLPAATIGGLFARYEDEKRRRGLIDFDDLLVLSVLAMENDAEFAAGQHWRFRHLFVDEFQDVNPLQFRLLEAWRDGRRDLCVVGDPDQAIYGWNGADRSLLTDFEHRFPAATVVRLADNFRSTPQVLAAAHAVLRTGGPTAPPLRPHRPDGRPLDVCAYSSDLDEARGVARGVRDRRRPGMPWSHIAVLARTHAQLALASEALAAAGVPHRVRGTSSVLSRDDVRAALADLRRLPPGTPLGSAAGADGDLGDLSDLAREYRSVDPAATVDGFLAWLVATGAGDTTDDRTDAVVLATFHAAKGLEWPVVFLTGLEQGLVPIGHARGDALEEERRLLYVAVTRAESELHCSWASRRTRAGRAIARSASPWLDALTSEPAGRDAPGAAGRRRRVVDERRRLRAPAGRSNGAARLVAALREWRTSTARLTGVPVHVVMADRTIDALARACPISRAELLDVHGIGPVKAERYGADLLSLVASHADRASAP